MQHDATAAWDSSWRGGEDPLTALAALQLSEDEEAPRDITWDWGEEPLTALVEAAPAPATQDFVKTPSPHKDPLSEIDVAVAPGLDQSTELPTNNALRNKRRGVLRKTPVGSSETMPVKETTTTMQGVVPTTTEKQKTRTTPEMLGVQPHTAWKDATQHTSMPRVKEPQRKQKKHQNKTPTNAAVDEVQQRNGATHTRRQPRTMKAHKRISREMARDLLRKTLAEERPLDRSYADEVEFAEHYTIARNTTYLWMPDGYQRKSTPIQDMTMFLWQSRAIHLSEPPKFITETLTLKERMYWRGVHQKTMGYKLCVALPEQLDWHEEDAKYKFCVALVERNHPVDAGPDSEVLEFVKDFFTFTCSTEDHSAVFTFVRPEVRDKWLNKSFKFPFHEITLTVPETESAAEA